MILSIAIISGIFAILAILMIGHDSSETASAAFILSMPLIAVSVLSTWFLNYITGIVFLCVYLLLMILIISYRNSK